MKNNICGKIIYVVCLGVLDLLLLPATIYTAVWGTVHSGTIFAKKNFTAKLACRLARFRGAINMGLIKVLKMAHIFNEKTFNEYYYTTKYIVDTIKELEGP